MPIRPELRKFYGREWLTVTRPRILARAKNYCEQCGKPNGALVWTRSERVFPKMIWAPYSILPTEWRDQTGAFLGIGTAGSIDVTRAILTVLTIAHLNHVSGDDRDENLKALCQWCHLNYDKLHHAETRAIRKDAARPLLVAS